MIKIEKLFSASFYLSVLIFVASGASPLDSYIIRVFKGDIEWAGIILIDFIAER